MTRATYFAVAGDVHGRWSQLAEDVATACRFLPAGARLSAIFQVGDAEPTLDERQLAEVDIKLHRRQLSDFARVVAGEVTFPAPLYFIGGNHEPWPTLDRNGGLDAGGPALAPGVAFLGRAGVTTAGGLRVAYLSGVRHPACAPTTAAERTAGGDIRELNFYAPEELQRVVAADHADILLTHDWPAGSGWVHKTRHVGDPAVRELLQRLRPAASFHGHYHRSDDFSIDGVDVFAMGLHGQGVPEAVAIFEFDHATRRVSKLSHLAAQAAECGA